MREKVENLLEIKWGRDKQTLYEKQKLNENGKKNINVKNFREYSVTAALTKILSHCDAAMTMKIYKAHIYIYLYIMLKIVQNCRNLAGLLHLMKQRKSSNSGGAIKEYSQPSFIRTPSSPS